MNRHITSDDSGWSRMGKCWEGHAASAVITLLIIACMPAVGFPGHRSSAAERSVRDFYISPKGSDSNLGTKAGPFLSFAKADSVVRPGDTVHVLPGTYRGYTAQKTIRVTTGGSASAPIRWIAETKWAARIVGHVNPDNDLGWGILVAGDYIDLIGFDVTSDANMGIWVTGNHVRVIGNHVHDIPGQPGCTSYGASGIEQGNYSGGSMEVIGNVVHHIGAGGPGSCNKYQGIYLAAPYDKAVNNISYHNASKGIAAWHAATHNTISNNTVFDNDVGILVGAGDSPCYQNCSADYMVVSNNIIYHNRSIGFWQYSGVGPHNTYSNNLTFANGVENAFLQGNCGNTTSATCNTFANVLNLDPQFVSPTGDFFTGDYHVKDTSRARKAGTALGVPPTDFDGKPRGTGFAPDLGAYSSGSVSSN